jgi:hypothetical protein
MQVCSNDRRPRRLPHAPQPCRVQGPLGHSHTPPEELNRFAVHAPSPSAAANFGFPFCYGTAPLLFRISMTLISTMSESTTRDSHTASFFFLKDVMSSTSNGRLPVHIHAPTSPPRWRCFLLTLPLSDSRGRMTRMRGWWRCMARGTQTCQLATRLLFPPRNLDSNPKSQTLINRPHPSSHGFRSCQCPPAVLYVITSLDGQWKEEPAAAATGWW